MNKLSRFKTTIHASKETSPEDFIIIVLGAFKILGIQAPKVTYGFASSKIQGNTTCNAYVKLFDKFDITDFKRLTKFLDSREAYMAISHLDTKYVEFNFSVQNQLPVDTLYKIVKDYNLKTIGG